MERSSPSSSSKPPLHNFSLPYLRWGNQRLLRCVKVDSPPSSPSRPSPTREKPTGTLFASPPPPPPPPPIEVDPASTRPPWNLRTRRAACKAPSPLRVALEGGGTYQHLDGGSPRREREKEKEVVGNGGGGGVVVKFSVSLTREEIEEDFMEMGRNRPPRRPKKRPRVVQKYLDSVFPGLWLSEITPDSYKVAEVVES